MAKTKSPHVSETPATALLRAQGVPFTEHPYEYVEHGGAEHSAEVIAVGKWFEKVMARICIPFLSEAEIGRILKGSDLWMDSDEISHRLMRMQRAQDKEKRAGKTAPKAKKVKADASVSEQP